MNDILNPIDSKDSEKKGRIKFDDKKLEEMTLPEHARLLNEMQSFIEDNEELTEDEKKVMDKINLSSEKKVLAWCYVIKQIKEAQEINKHMVKYHEEKIKLLKIRNNTLQNRIDNRMDRIDDLMKLAGKTKIEGANSTVVYRKMPEKLRLLTPIDELDQKKYPTCFKNVPASVEWSKKELLKHAKLLEGKKNNDFEVYRDEPKLEVK